MLNVETPHPSHLSPADIALWRDMAAAEPAFANPLLGPDFTQAVGQVREDARVAVIRKGGETLGFLPHHRRPGRLARAIGSPLSDYHGIVSRPDPGFTAGDVLRAADLGVFRYTGLIDPFGLFGQPAEGGEAQSGFVIAPEGSAEDHLEVVRAASPKKIKNYRRLDHKLDREVGAVRLVAADTSRQAFDQLLAWKREQLQRTGMHDFLRPAWTGSLLTDLFQRQTGDFQGLMINLYAGDELVAGHFGVRLAGVYHPWIASTNPAFGAWSPGQIFFLRAIAAMPELGLTHYDLGPGHDHYKRAYAFTQTPVQSGSMMAASVAGLMASSVEGVWNLAGAGGNGVVARLRRRMDVINSVELTMGGQVRGLVDAVAGQSRRRVGGHEAG
jgi:CelD/BcsL family acetyltransferase involved in cellulose biosynthesis